MQYEGLSVFDLILSSGGPALKAQVEQNTFDIGVSGLNIGANSNNIISLQQKTNQITKGPYSTTIDDLVILTSGLHIRKRFVCRIDQQTNCRRGTVF